MLQVRRRNLVTLQMWPAIQAEPLRWLFTTLLSQEPNGIDRDRTDRQGTLDRVSQLRPLQRLQQPQHADEFTSSIGLAFSFKPTPEHVETVWQIPVRQRPREVQ